MDKNFAFYKHHNQGPSNCLISGSGGNFDNLVDKQFTGRFPCCNFLTILMLLNQINKHTITTVNKMA